MVGQHGDPGRGAEPDRGRGWMNYVYDPKDQAQIEAYVNYVTPVNGDKEILLKRTRRSPTTS